MTRHKDVDWNLRPVSVDNTVPLETIQLALLMDIRDELKAMREQLRSIDILLHCTNTVRIPRTLARIDRRLATKLPLKKS